MRLTSWNFLHGLPTSFSENPVQGYSKAILALETDVLGLQEVDYFLTRSGNENQVAQIASLLETPHWAFAPGVMGSPEEKWRAPAESDAKIVSEKVSGGPGFGIGLVSKIPVTSWHRLDLNGGPKHPGAALAAVLENGWLIINTQLSSMPVFNYMQLLQIKRWARHLPIADKSKIIIMGDLNMRLTLLVRGINWNSLAEKATFPSWAPVRQIDYILSQKVASEDVINIKCTSLGISDHLPICVELDQ